MIFSDHFETAPFCAPQVLPKYSSDLFVAPGKKICDNAEERSVMKGKKDEIRF